MTRGTWIGSVAVVGAMLVSGVAGAQETGVKFESDVAWPELQARAQREQKFIFLAWPGECASCDEEIRQVYAQEQVGRYFNDRFISAYIPPGPVASSGEVKPVRGSAGERDLSGGKLQRQYRLAAAPAVLFFSPDGKLVHRARGDLDPEDLIATAGAALDPERQYYTLLAQYRRGQRDLPIMFYLYRTAQSLGDREVASTIARDYVARAQDSALLAKDKIPLVWATTERSSDRGFAFFRRYARRIDQIMGADGYAERMVDRIIEREEVAPRARFHNPAPDWDAIVKVVARKYSVADADRIVGRAKQERARHVEQLAAAQLDDRTRGDLNGRAWALFGESSDRAELRAAIAWMARVLEEEGDHPDPNHMDTYANLLYKVGRADEAIRWQERALTLAKPTAWYYEGTREHLDKMKKGEPTWPQP